MECSDQRGNEICLFLPNRWPVSYRDDLHSTLHLLCSAIAVPSFLTTGIYGSSGLPSCTYFITQEACWDTNRDFLVRKPSQVCLLPAAWPQGLFFFFNRTFSALLIFPDPWQSGSCFLFPRCTFFSCCLFSINFQMLLHILFIFSTVCPFLNFCIVPFYTTFAPLQMNSRSLLQLHQI